MNGPEILDSHGNVVWFHAIPQGQTAADFRVQRGLRPARADLVAGNEPRGLSDGTDYIYNTHYQQIAALKAGNGLTRDGHEFLIAPRNTALILSYNLGTADLTSIGGPAEQSDLNGTVQELDISTGAFVPVEQRRHVPYGQSEQPLPLRRARRGTGPTSTPCIWTRRKPAGRRTRHMDDV